MRFHAGQKVICINNRLRDDDHQYGNGHETLVKAGCVYTIREIIRGAAHGYAEDGLLLVEIVKALDDYVGPSGPVTCEMFFRASRFFPVQTTNIDVLLQMPARVRITWWEDLEYEAWLEAFSKANEARERGDGQ